MAEFTGERVIPGQVDIDLFNEHMARYAFAARLARGKRALDAGCGAGYGSAELARAALTVVGIDSSLEAIEYARASYPLPNLKFEQASCEALPHADASFDLIVAFEVIEHLVVDAVDDRTHHLLQQLEIQQQPGCVQFPAPQRQADLVVVAMRILALAAVVARVMSG